MTILDCETLESAYESVAVIYGVNIKRVKAFADSVDANKDPDYDVDIETAYITAKARAFFGSEPEYDGTYWFHVTRTWRENFDNGLHPLNMVLDEIWSFLFSLVCDKITEDEWKSFQKDFKDGNTGHYSYIQKQRLESQDYGPFAILILDTARQSPNRDYQVGGEACEDIWTDFNKRFEIDLEQRFRNATKPCIIKFSDQGANIDNLGVALMHLCCTAHGDSVRNRSFSGEGRSIPPSRIDKILWPKDTVRPEYDHGTYEDISGITIIGPDGKELDLSKN